jgi:hypothetical protein
MPTMVVFLAPTTRKSSVDVQLEIGKLERTDTDLQQV